MVVVSVGDGGGEGAGAPGPAPALAHYPAQYTPRYPGPRKFPPKGDYPPAYDSDSNSDHSSSGRGSGGSDLGSEVDRESTRLEDSGRYSADGCETDLQPPPLSSVTAAHNSPHKRLPHNNSDNSKPSHVAPTQAQTPSSNKSDNQGREDQIKGHRRAPRSAPVTHPPVDAPLCVQCARRDLAFFDPGCSGCAALLRRLTTTPSHLFAVMRQWVPQVQHNIHHLIGQLLSMGCHVDDRDALTDMTLLHYAVKAGSNGVGDPATALQVAKQLLRDGADVHQRCRWTHMTALHYSAYFDVAPVLDLLLRDPQGVCINDACLEYSGGAPLHIAAANLSLAAVRVLLQHGALPTLTDTQGRTPFQCIPTPDQYELVPDVQDVIAKLRSCLSPTASHVHMAAHAYTAHNSSSQGSSGKAVLKAMGLKLCDRVLISGVKTGTLRFVGTTEFATGLWAGVELETPTGRHNGTVKGVMYFRCAKNYGIFVPVNRLTKIPHVNGGRQGRSTSVSQRQRAKTMSRRSVSLPPGRVNHGRVDVSRVSSRVAQDIHNTTRKIVVGDRVYVDMGMGSGSTRVVTGVVRYTGGVHFASSFWVGVELDVPRGTNDGSVNGTRYFTCRSQHGIFASPSRIIKISTEQNVDGSLDLCEPSTLRFSRHSLSSGHGSNTTINMISSGSLSLGYPAPISYSSHGPMSLGSSGTIMGVGSSSTINLDCNGAMTQNMNECCATCSSSCHLLDNQVYGSVKSAQSAKTAIYPPNTSMTSLNRSFSARYVTSRQRQEELERAAEEKKKEQTWYDPPVLPVTPKAQRKKRENQHWLEIGHNVFYKNEVGVIKYIGQVDFEAGTWLGVELRAAKGRHDGTVRGRRYFSCRPRHGVMVKPSKVYVRGINGAKLVKPEDDFEE
ncbi:CAP-Gly domain-containing linker protein 3-like [Homarus americanus]|uniref:CAP-Gly domain-containing linker protein 3-like n=1 Tax=Homarus americanus TaxID=6706 RepID=UPI001C47132E|nr:CAP-Gly domain-containing linker protein 3-like [Homarus americanus]